MNLADTALLYTETLEVLKELQKQNDKPYNVRDLGEALVVKHPTLADIPIVNLTKRLACVMAHRERNNVVGLRKERAVKTNVLGGSYLYYLENKVA